MLWVIKGSYSAALALQTMQQHTALPPCRATVCSAVTAGGIRTRVAAWRARISAVESAGAARFERCSHAGTVPSCQPSTACAPTATPIPLSSSSPQPWRSQAQQQPWPAAQQPSRVYPDFHHAPWDAHDDVDATAASTHEHLAAVLSIPLHAFDSMAARAPAVALFQPHTLSLTREALGYALHLEPHQVSRLAEIEPQVLLQPDRAGRTARALGQELGLRPQALATLARSHLPALALAPDQVHSRLAALTQLLHLEGDAAAAWLRGHPSKAVALLAQPPAAVALKLAALCEGLGCAEGPTAALVRHRPLLLHSSALVARTRLFALAEAGCMGMHEVVSMAADSDQDAQGLADLLLLSPQTLWFRFQHLAQLLPHAEPAFVLRLLLRCAGQGTSTADAYVRWQALLSATRDQESPWADELQACDSQELALLLGASHVQMARLAFVTGQQRQSEMGLREAAGMSDEAFAARCGGFQAWLAAS